MLLNITMIVVGWTQELIPFEAIQDNIPLKRTYKDQAMDVLARMDLERCHQSSSPTDDFQMADHLKEPPTIIPSRASVIDMLSKGKDLMDIKIILKICS
jgi:hypothetical protein